MQPHLRSANWSDAELVEQFTRDLDHWGARPNAKYHHVSDPFLMAVICPANLQFTQLHTIINAFETLDDLLAATPRELAAIKGVGRKTVKAISDELFMRGLKMRKAN